MRGVAHLVDVAGADALLDVGKALPGRMLHRAHQVGDERVHAGGGEEDGRVVLGDDRRAGDDGVALGLEESEVEVPQFVCGDVLHIVTC